MFHPPFQAAAPFGTRVCLTALPRPALIKNCPIPGDTGGLSRLHVPAMTGGEPSGHTSMPGKPAVIRRVALAQTAALPPPGTSTGLLPVTDVPERPRLEAGGGTVGRFFSKRKSAKRFPRAIHAGRVESIQECRRKSPHYPARAQRRNVRFAPMAVIGAMLTFP